MNIKKIFKKINDDIKLPVKYYWNKKIRKNKIKD